VRKMRAKLFRSKSTHQKRYEISGEKSDFIARTSIYKVSVSHSLSFAPSIGDYFLSVS